MRTYLRTGRISWSPTDSEKAMLANVANVGIGSTFSATLDSPTEKFLIGSGVISVTTPLRRTIPCFFTFDSPGLASGLAVYTPTVGDILHDAWIEIDTAWNGTTPMGDVGGFPGVTYGWFASLGNPVDMTRAANAGSIFDSQMFVSPALAPPPLLSVAVITGYPSFSTAYQAVPARFVLANPVKVCVSTTGQTNGADPGATQGAAVLYLDISTPQAA